MNSETEGNLPVELQSLITASQLPEYAALITQLRKDFQRAGVGIHLRYEQPVHQLFRQVYHTLMHMLETDPNKFTALMYLADVNRDSFQEAILNRESLAQLGAVLLIKREYIKIKTRAGFRQCGGLKNKPG